MDKSRSTTQQRGQSQPSAKDAVLAALRVIGLLIGASLALSFLLTGTYTWNYKIPPWSKIKYSIFMKEVSLTPEELKQFDGTDPSKPIYLAVMGEVFDVTAGKETYGPGGGYSFFAGRDAGRAYVTGCFKTHLTPDLRGLTKEQIAEIENWRSFYATHDKYFYVGRVNHPPIDPNSPIPEDCKEHGS